MFWFALWSVVALATGGVAGLALYWGGLVVYLMVRREV